MKLALDFALARPADARAVALLSRDAIEHGLPWRWTAARVLRAMTRADTNVVVARVGGAPLAGFAVMSYGEQDAHLQLFAVAAAQRRQGVGSALLDWLEATARTAGIGVIRLETRIGNRGAQAFYRACGYVAAGTVPRYYEGGEDALRLAKDLLYVG